MDDKGKVTFTKETDQKTGKEVDVDDKTKKFMSAMDDKSVTVKASSTSCNI